MTVNGKVYDWADVDFKIPGLDIEVQEISYDDELDQEAVYGRGNKPRGFGTGNYSSTGKISLLRDDYRRSCWPIARPRVSVSSSSSFPPSWSATPWRARRRWSTS